MPKVDLDSFPDLILAKLADGEKVYALIEDLCFELKAAREIVQQAKRIYNGRLMRGTDWHELFLKYDEVTKDAKD